MSNSFKNLFLFDKKLIFLNHGSFGACPKSVLKGGLDLVVLGVGSNGHIGFNEPFSVRNSRTRVCLLDPVTRRSAASDFFGEENVPTQGITLGLGTIFSAKQIVLAALGEHKAGVIKELSE